MNEKAWVIAKNGLVGKDMVKYLEQNGILCTSTTRSEVDVTNIESIREYCKKQKPTHIINCSANVNVDLAEKEEKHLAYLVNVKGVENLAWVAKEENIRLIHISTDYVFDGTKKSDYTEEDQVNPINIYGLTKAEGEKNMLKIYPEALSIRTASVFGAGKDGLITGVIKMLENEEEAKAIIDQTSTPTYSKHIARALWDLRNQKGIFHFVNKGLASRFDLVEELMHLAKYYGKSIKCLRVRGVKSKEFGRAAKRPVRSVLDTQKAEKLFLWKIPTWQEALREYLVEIQWIKKER